MNTLNNHTLYYEDLKIHKKRVLGHTMFLVSSWTIKHFGKSVTYIKQPVRRLGSRRIK